MRASTRLVVRLLGLGLPPIAGILLVLGSGARPTPGLAVPASSGASSPVIPGGAPALLGPAERSLSARVPDEPRPAVRLRVLDATSARPPDRAEVVCFVRGPDGAVRVEEACDGEGRWGGSPLPGRPFFVRAPGHLDQDARATLDGGSGESVVRLVSFTLRTVALAVVDAGGRPVPGAEVRISRPQATLRTTGDGGRVLLRLPSDTPSLRLEGEVAAPGFVTRAFGALDDGRGTLRVWNRDLPEEARAVILDQSASACGRLADGRSAPLAGLPVRASTQPFEKNAAGCAAPGEPCTAWSTTSDAGGAYELADLPAGRVLFWRIGDLESGAGEDGAPIRLAAGSTGLDWRLGSPGPAIPERR